MRQNEFYILYKIITDPFTLHGASPNMPLSKILEHVLKQNPAKTEGSRPSDYKILVARQVVDPGNMTIKDLDLNDGDYLLFYQPPITSVRLRLIPPAAFRDKHKGWLIQNSPALVGRADEEIPDVDLTPLLKDPLRVSRKLAVLEEEEESWTIRLHGDAHSIVYVGDVRLERNMVVELNNDTVIRFGKNPNDPDLVLKVKLEPVV
ncbi:MAG: FHA domain-containing protein [Bellilinea sp.]|nr:FHA domain-containing protein [Bellilinea sp.]